MYKTTHDARRENHRAKDDKAGRKEQMPTAADSQSSCDETPSVDRPLWQATSKSLLPREMWVYAPPTLQNPVSSSKIRPPADDFSGGSAARRLREARRVRRSISTDRSSGVVTTRRPGWQLVSEMWCQSVGRVPIGVPASSCHCAERVPPSR